MKWRKPPAELVEIFHELVPDDPAVDFRPMFGGPCYWVNGNMFAAVHQESIVVRLGEAERTDLLVQPGAAPFEPMPGRIMKEYVVLPEAMVAAREPARAWLARGLAYTSSLPPKQKQPRKAKRRPAAKE